MQDLDTLQLPFLASKITVTPFFFVESLQFQQPALSPLLILRLIYTDEEKVTPDNSLVRGVR